MSENTSAGDHPLGPIDGTQQYITERPYGDENGQTVGGSSPDDEGSVTTVSWPAAVDADPDDLTHDQAAVIRAAADRKRDWGSLSELSQVVVPKRDRSYAQAVLRKYWPEAKERIKDGGQPEPLQEAGDGEPTDNEERARRAAPSITQDDVAEMRNRVLRGETAKSVGADYGLSPRQTYRHIRGETTVDPDDPPALKFAGDEWLPADPEATAGQRDTTEDPTGDGSEGVSNTDADTQKIAVKPGRSVYHLCAPDGQIYCTHAGATKPGTTSNGYLRAEVTDVSGDWTCCDVCESFNGPPGSNLTYGELVEFVRQQLGVSRQSNTFNKSELTQIARQFFDSEEDFRERVVAFIEEGNATQREVDE